MRMVSSAVESSIHGDSRVAGQPQIIDPVEFAKQLWPDVTFYKQQKQILYSLIDADETYVPAGNMLGKDFVTAYAALWFFLTRVPCRVVTTSVDGTQLEGVLWGEIRRFIQTCKYPLSHVQDGPLVINHLHIRKMFTAGPKKGQMCGLSYLIGRVAAKGEGMLGHHAHPDEWDGFTPYTLFCADEASGVDDISYERADTWAHRKLIIGNPYPCQNFFRRGVRNGTQLSEDYTNPITGTKRVYSRVITIRAQDSPNVRYAEAEQAAGLKPSNRIVLPGVLSYAEYKKRRDTWLKDKQCVGLDARFWEGADTLFFPPNWLDRAAKRAVELNKQYAYRKPQTLGVDPAEGGDNTCFALADNFGLIELVSHKTPDTGDIVDKVITLIKQHDLESENVLIDRGGGGKQVADQLRRRGYEVRTISFGEPVNPKIKHGRKQVEERLFEREEKYTYFNRRAELYGRLRERIEPGNDLYPEGYGIPGHTPAFQELRRQLSLMPMVMDSEMKVRMLPKYKKSKDSKEETLVQLLGCSPDESDAAVLAVYATQPDEFVTVAGALFS